MSVSPRKAAIFAARLAVVAVIYALIAPALDWHVVATALTPVLALSCVVAAVLTLAQAALNTVRWRLLARPLPDVPPFGASFFAYTEGMFVNQALPSFVGGDAVRVGRWRAWGVALGDAVESVLIDRIYGVFGAACLALVAIALLWSFADLRPWLVAGGVVVTAGTLVCALVFACLLRPPPAREPRGPRLVRALLARIARFHVTARNVLVCIVTAVGGHLFAGVGAWVIARSLDIDAPMAVIVSGMALVTLLAMIPISLAGWGVREAGFLALLGPFGVPPEKAVLLGVAIGAQALVAALPGGLSLLLGLAAPRR